LVFGFLIDVPLLTTTFILLFVLRKTIAAKTAGTRLPRFLLYLLAAVPLIVFEEQIDCMPAWCGKVAIPPTLYFLEIEMLVLGLLVVYVHASSALRVAAAFSVYGILFEYLVGGLRGLPPSLEAVFLVPYVGMGYAFISLLPLEVLLGGRREAEVRVMAPAAIGGGGPSTAVARIKVSMKLAVKAAGDWW
jgi:hypothetical protein